MTMIASFVTYTLYSQLRKATGPLDLGIKTDGLLSGEDGSFRDRVASVVARLKEAASMEVEAHTSWAGESPTAAPATTNSEKEADRMKPNDAPETTDNTAKSVPKASPKVAEEGKGKDEEKAKSGPNNKGEAPKKAPKKEPTKKEPKKAPAPKEAPKKDASKAAPKEAASKQSSKKEDKGTKKASITTSSSKHSKVPAAMTSKPVLQPVKGPIATNGSKPLWNMQHKGTDAIMALACKYPVQFYKRFVGSLRKAGFSEDIVLAVSPVNQMKPGVEAYLKEQQVVSYAFEVDCAGPDNCKLRDEFLG
jgi:DNA polymerase III gamma/tau subunit